MPDTKTTTERAAIETGTVDRASPDAKGRYLVLKSGRQKQVDLEKRYARFCASGLEVDRYGTVILPSAVKARLAKFARHSPFLAAHMGWIEAGLPTQIGTIQDIDVEPARFTIGVVYARTQLAEQYWLLASDPEQSVAVSIGFIPVRWIRGTAADLLKQFPELAGPFTAAGLASDDTCMVYTEIELLEVSQVSVPANSEAVQLAMRAATGLSDAAPGRRAAGEGAALLEGLEPAMVRAVAEAVARAIAPLLPLVDRVRSIDEELEELKFIIADNGTTEDLEAERDISPPAGRDGPPAADEDGELREALARLRAALNESTS